ncbi:MAG: nicotinate (nicotinamide) nucleotide adenylyltransferase [Armatimonadetes bacterium]|nr:nicotinate (nicotinamide) nucleotide adenylyltransferase [Armatimonadota bacterium]MBS1702510.1 nicotinate (nicotinamide) nucleotide adenylyltransferase [Armatimonadota bacterium]
MRIGILGGTFDPPHLGHLKLAEAAIESLQLDEVILLPANTNPFKGRQRTSSAKDRAAMTQLLQKRNPKLSFSDMEITRGGVSYTVDTLGELQMVHPGDYWFIMGADAVKNFGEWKNPQRILRLCRLAVAVRPPTTKEDLSRQIPAEFRDKIDIIDMATTAESSTEIRERLQKGQPIQNLTIPEVSEYIKKNKLYT